MSMEDICRWCVFRSWQNSKQDFTERGNVTRHSVEFENGDKYICEEAYAEGDMRKRVTITINGEEVYAGDYRYANFGWEELTA